MGDNMGFQSNEFGVGSIAVGGGLTAATVVTPTVPAASTDFRNTTGIDAFVYITVQGTAVSVTIKDPLGVQVVAGIAPSASRMWSLPVGWIINLGAYTVAPTWNWQAAA